MSTHRRFLQILSVIVILSMMFASFSVPTVFAQEKDGVKRQHNAQTGKVSFIGPESGTVVSASKALGISPSARPADPGMALAKRFGPEFGLKNPARELTAIKTARSDGGRKAFHYQQNYQGIPVVGGELIVNTNENGDLYSINGEISPDLSLPTQPTIDSAQARQTALQAAAKWYQATPGDFLASEPELWVFDESLLLPSTRPVELVWRMEVTSKGAGVPVRELVLVNAEKGGISLHINQIDTAWGKTQPGVHRTTTNSTTAPAPALAGANWYVATTGSNTNLCTTPALPCADIQKAISLASSGDVIYVADGIYYHPGSALNLTPNVVILDKSLSLSGGWIGNFSSQSGMSVIDGADTNNGILVTATGNSVVDHFFVRDATATNGGALYVDGANLTLRNSTLYGNSAEDYGAGVYSTGNGHVTIVTSTIGNNSSYAGGTVYADSGTIEIQNSTVVFNIGGLQTNSIDEEISVQSSIIWENSLGNCPNEITSLDYNIFPADQCDYYPAFHDQFGNDPQLDAFVPSGGYYPLSLGSPAIDAGPWICPSFDQRGVSRPQSALCDIGAYEYEFNGGTSDLRLQTYDAANSWALPGTLVCDQNDLDCMDGDAHEKAAHQYAAGTYALYKTAHNRNGIDDNGLEIISSVHYGYQYSNASWNGYMMVYGDEWDFPLADDIVAHELTHGVTQYESNLFYFYQAGAINESLSDLWGEYYDQVFNVTSTDTAGVKWLIGEDTSDPLMGRSMSDPTLYDDPDKMSSIFYRFTAGDNGGVHHNSGINNKAIFLMVEGDDDFNGVTVLPVGWTKTAAIYYKANTDLLTSGADYSDLYYALQLACSALTGEGTVTAADCVQVKNALDAVEMNAELPDFNTDPPLCKPDSTLNVLFTDDFETETGNWTFDNGAYPRWQLDSSYGQYAHSGSHALYAADFPDTVTDAKAQLSSFAVPLNAYLYFAHAYEFDTISTTYFDGGIVEYSIDGGSTWADAGSLMDEENGYNGTIVTGTYNPLEGRSAFVDSSHGYIGTRLNLSYLAGKTATFRWRMGLDLGVDVGGWWVDDLQIYQCIPTPLSTGTYDDADDAWTYGGRWLTYSGAGPLNNTMHYNNATGATANFTFQAPARFILSFQKASNRSNILISVDGGTPVSVSAYSSSSQWRQTYTSPMYTDSNAHTVTVITPGDGKYIDIDAIQIVGPPTPHGVGIYDDANAAWTYAGTWSTWSGTGPLNNTLHYANATGATATFTFQAPAKFVLTYSTNTNRGNIMVSVDGGTPVPVNSYGSAVWQKTYASLAYADSGAHTVTITTPGDGKYIDIDAIQIITPTDLTKPAAISDLSATTGTATGSVNLSWTAVGDDGTTGTATAYLVRYSTSAINSEATWNAATPVTSGIPTPLVAGTLQNMIVSGLTPDQTYYFAIRAQDEEPNLGDVSNPASATAQAMGAAGTGMYDDADANWKYTGSWSTYTGTGPYSNTMHYTNATGATATFKFQAPARFILSFQKASNRSNILVSVDGGTAVPVSAYSSSGLWRQTYTSAMYSDTGSHTVVVSTPGDGKYIDVDAIQIVAPPTPHGVGIYDDANAAWTYAGTWSTWSGTGPLNNTLHYANATGATATFTFQAPAKFVLTYSTNTNRGNIMVSVDGGTPVPVNSYGSAVWQKTYASLAYADSGAHTVTITTPGDGKYIDIDAIQIITPTDLTKPAAISDLSATTGTATGSVNLSWTAVGDDGTTGTATAYLVRYSTSAINSEATWNAATPVTSGIPTPLVAGTLQNMIVSGLTPDQTYYFAIRAQDEEPNLGDVSNPASATAQAMGAAGAGMYDDADANWKYTGSWSTYTGTGPYSNTMHYTNATGATATFKFQAPARFILSFQKASNRSNILVSVDGGTAVPVSAYSSSGLWRQTYTSAMYSDTGSHTVVVSTPGDGKYIDIDAIQIVAPPTPLGVGTYDNTNAGWTYTGSWGTYNGTGPLNNTLHYSNATGATATFTFQGPAKFVFTYSTNTNRGNILISVDGGATVPVNAYGSALWLQTYTSPTYTGTGSHTVTISTPGDGKYIDVDAIQIMNP